MNVTVHVFVTPRRCVPVEDLGMIAVTPKPERAGQVKFPYRGKLVIGTVTLNDPYNWEKRPGAIPQVHVHLG